VRMCSPATSRSPGHRCSRGAVEPYRRHFHGWVGRSGSTRWGCAGSRATGCGLSSSGPSGSWRGIGGWRTGRSARLALRVLVVGPTPCGTSPGRASVSLFFLTVSFRSTSKWACTRAVGPPPATDVGKLLRDRDRRSPIVGGR
jgi:hypothetical protein